MFNLMLKFKVHFLFFVVLLIISCNGELTFEDVIRDKKTPDSKFVVILSPDTGI